MKYKPGSQDSFEVLRRRQRRMLRGIREANAPTGSNVYGTTSKVQAYMSNAEGLEGRLADVEKKIADTDKRLESVESKQKDISARLAELGSLLDGFTDRVSDLEKAIKDIDPTPDACVITPSNNLPSDQWKKLGSIETDEKNMLYVYERI